MILEMEVRLLKNLAHCMCPFCSLCIQPKVSMYDLVVVIPNRIMLMYLQTLIYDSHQSLFHTLIFWHDKKKPVRNAIQWTQRPKGEYVHYQKFPKYFMQFSCWVWALAVPGWRAHTCPSSHHHIIIFKPWPHIQILLVFSLMGKN